MSDEHPRIEVALQLNRVRLEHEAWRAARGPFNEAADEAHERLLRGLASLEIGLVTGELSPDAARAALVQLLAAYEQDMEESGWV